MSPRSIVAVIGAFPPPVHGLSNINEAMAQKLSARVEVFKVDTALAARNSTLRGKCVARVRLVWRIVQLCMQSFRNRPSAFYIGLSGGMGQLVDAIFVCLARLMSIPVFFHHHSFRYVNKRDIVTEKIFRISPAATHIVLCSDMGNMLKRRYPARVKETIVLSNAVFLSSPGQRQEPRSLTTLITVGFLSNITRDKGIFVFFDTLSRLTKLGVNFRAIVAGPVDDLILGEFAEVLSRFPTARHIGAVYGAKKKDFLAQIDFLLFPSMYKNEAEPLTIIEAMQVGVPVIASDLGCIRSLFSRGGGKAFSTDEHLSANMAEYLAALIKRTDLYDELSGAAMVAHATEDAAAASLEELVLLLAGARSRF